MAGGDDRLNKLDERVLDGVVAVDKKEELGGGAVKTTVELMAFPLYRLSHRRYIRWAPKRRRPRAREGVMTHT